MKHAHALLFATLAALISMPTLAHHGQAAYDRDVTITISGVVTEFRFTNPHVRVLFDVINQSGEVEQWIGAATAPNKLARAGWTKSTLKPGDEIELSGRRGRSDAKAMHINQIVTADGRALQMREQIDNRNVP